MKRKIFNFIATEKDLARYKIKLLELTDRPYSKRLINKEEDFINYDFSAMTFDDIHECRYAINLFKISKSRFLLKYENHNYNKSLYNKVLRYADNISIKEGLIDQFPFKSLSKKKFYKENGELKKIITKRIASLKLLLTSAASIINKEGNVDISYICKNVYKNIHSIDLKDFDSNLLDEIKSNYINIFNIYNYRKIQVINKTKNTDILILPILHSGNEKVNSLYIKLMTKSGNRIVLINDKFSNYPINNSYYKCLKIKRGQVNGVKDIDLGKSIILCNFSRRDMENNSENILWLKFVLNKIID